jgi:hypothetical protein
LRDWTRAERRLLRLARLSAPAQTRQPRVIERIGEALADLLQPRAVLEAARAGI